MSQNEDLARFDVRTIERYLKDGTVTQEQYQRYLESLEDCGAEGTSDRQWDNSSVRMQAHRRRRIEVQIEDEET